MLMRSDRRRSGCTRDDVRSPLLRSSDGWESSEDSRLQLSTDVRMRAEYQQAGDVSSLRDGSPKSHTDPSERPSRLNQKLDFRKHETSSTKEDGDPN